MAVFIVWLPALLAAMFALSEATPPVSQVDSETIRGDQKNDLIGELQQMKLKIARLELIMEESIKNLNTKSLHLEEHEKLISEMTQKIHFLQTALISIKGDSSYAEERINALEEEVRLLWADSRKNNFHLHILESKSQDSEERLEMVNSQVENMADIVTEQWIQIRQLEQALQITMRTLKAQRKAGSNRCSFLKFINDFRGHHLQKIVRVLDPYFFIQKSFSSPYMSQALHQFKRFMSAVKKYHHELQFFVKQEMEKNDFAAALANEEVVFFVASALITFPVMAAWMWLSSWFS